MHVVEEQNCEEEAGKGGLRCEERPREQRSHKTRRREAIKQYLNLPKLQRNNDPLKTVYLELYEIASSHLLIPATSVASERTASQLKPVLGVRSSLRFFISFLATNASSSVPARASFYFSRIYL